MKIITAIGSPELNQAIKENSDVEVIGKDIQYQDGVFEVLETRNDVDTVAVSNILPEEMSFLFFIEKIKKVNENIEIIVFLKTEDVSIENYLNSKKIYKIYYLDENGIEIFINSLKNSQNISNDISKEIEELRNMILLPQNNQDKEIDYESSIVTILGNPGSGKSSISCILAKQIEKQKKKVVLLDFDGSSKAILGLNSDVDNRIDVSKYLTVIFNVEEEIERNQIYNRYFITELITELKNEYEYIIIDTTSHTEYKYISTLLKSSTKVVFLMEANILGISKAQKRLEILINDINVDIDKIKIVFNKTSKYQIAESVLEEIFADFEEIGNISYDEKYSFSVEHNLKVLDMKNIYEIVC